MGKRALRKRIQSLQRRISEHELKIMAEKRKFEPDVGLIRHWENEIAAFRQNIKKAKKRLRS